MKRERKDLLQFRKQKGRPLLLDGAIGTQLIERGIEQDSSLWTSLANSNSPKIVKSVYEDYIKAGADIITSNTFRTNPLAAKSYGKAFTEKMIEAALEIAHKAAGNKEILIAGSNPPAEDCYQAERKVNISVLEANHREHIELLWEFGSDFILNETQSHFDEIMIISEICSTMEIPFVVSLLIDEELRLLSGEKIEKVIPEILRFSPAAIGINCVHPETFRRYHKENEINYNFGFYLNMGKSSHKVGVITGKLSPEDYLEEIEEYITDDLLFVGACCGSGPVHIKALRKHLDSLH